MRHIDLFSGIGGFAFAIDGVLENIEHTFVEYDPFCQAVLKKHYPNSTIHGDIDEYVVQLTGLSANEYNALHGLSTVEQIRERKEPLSKRDVSARHRELLRNIETGDVEDTLTKGMRDAEQFTIQGEQPLSQGDKSERQGTEHSGEGDTERFSGASDTLREVQGHGDIQRRADENTSASPGLQQTARGNVAMSEMSPRMAQTLQSNQLEHGRITTDSERKGWEREGHKTTRQHGLSNRTSADKKPYILTGGFPCQEFSVAGKRKGTAGARYKWPEMLSVIHFYKPEWVIAENVRGLTTWEQGLALETVLTNLEECGYSVWPLIIPACAVGAPHRRDRVWIVANCTDSRTQSMRQGRKDTFHGLECDASDSRQQLREQGRGEGLEANTTERTTRTEADKREHKYTWADDWREVAFATCHDGLDDGLPRQMGGITISASRHRKEQLKAHGNAIVPQVAMQIVKSIKSLCNQ